MNSGPNFQGENDIICCCCHGIMMLLSALYEGGGRGVGKVFCGIETVDNIQFGYVPEKE